MAASTLLLLLIFILNNAGMIKEKLFPILLILGGAGVITSIIFQFFGLNRLRRALDTPEVQTPRVPRATPETLREAQTNALPPKMSPASVTEGTTNLLDRDFVDEREKVPVSNKRTTRDLK